MSAPQLILTEEDLERLENVVYCYRGSVKDSKSLDMLEDRLDSARMVPAESVPEQVVTMNSRILIKEEATEEENEYILVYPPEADISKKKLSVLALLGASVIGHREGDIVEVPGKNGTRRLCLKKVSQEGLER